MAAIMATQKNLNTAPPDTKTQNHFVEKGNVYPHLLSSAAVLPILGAEVDNRHKISRKQITQN